MRTLLIRYTVFILSALALSACSTLERKAAVPASDLTRAQIAGMQSSRYLIATSAGINSFVDDVNRLNQRCFFAANISAVTMHCIQIKTEIGTK